MSRCEETSPIVRWSRRDSAAWYWPELLAPAEWAERYRWLELGESDRTGPWKNCNAPYLIGMMNLAAKGGVEQLAIKKATQLGVSEMMRNLMGCFAHQDPAPMGLLLPDKEKGREIVENKVLPFFRKNFVRHPDLRQLLSPRMHDMKKGQIALANGFILHLMWSGSPSSTASNPMKRALCDEVNKFAQWSGNDADPVSLVRNRLKTYADSLLVLVSSPTLASEGISVHFNASTDHLYFLVPCPSCGTRQRLVWEGIKIVPGAVAMEDRNAAAAQIRRSPSDCWYECVECHARWDERDKRRAVLGGKWGTVGEDEITGDGRIADAEAVDEYPAGTRLGLQLGSFYALWESCTLAHIAAGWMLARGNLTAMFDWRTGMCGEDFEEIVERVSVVDLSERANTTAYPESVLPWWTDKLIAAVDTQKDHFWLVLRAWGAGMRSRRVWHGRVESFADLDRLCFQTPWASEDKRIPARRADKVVIDSGGTRHVAAEGHEHDLADAAEYEGGLGISRTMEVYQWAMERAALGVEAIKGDARPRPGEFIRRGRGMYVTDRAKTPLTIWLLDTHHFQDELAYLMNEPVAEAREMIDPSTGEVRPATSEELEAAERLWQLNARHDPEYLRHMGNLQKVTVKDPRGNQQTLWRKKGPGVRVDYRACEGYQVAAAYRAGVHTLPTLAEWGRMRDEEIAVREQAAQAPPSPPAQFVPPRGGSFVATRD